MPRPCCTEPKCSRYAQPVQGSKSCLCERDEAQTPEELAAWIAAAARAGVGITLSRRETVLLDALVDGEAAPAAEAPRLTDKHYEKAREALGDIHAYVAASGME